MNTILNHIKNQATKIGITHLTIDNKNDVRACNAKAISESLKDAVFFSVLGDYETAWLAEIKEENAVKYQYRGKRKDGDIVAITEVFSSRIEAIEAVENMIKEDDEAYPIAVTIDDILEGKIADEEILGYIACYLDDTNFVVGGVRVASNFPVSKILEAKRAGKYNEKGYFLNKIRNN